MELNPKYLEEILEVLREAGVTRFECPAFSVSLSPEFVEKKDDIDEDLKRAFARKAAKAEQVVPGNIGHPSLWPAGMPSFPKREVENVSPFLGDSE